MNNLHKFYYKDYFDGVSYDHLLEESEASENRLIVERNKSLIDSHYSYKSNQEWKLKQESFIRNEAFEAFNENNKRTFSLEIVYPGLVTGIGINHETKTKGEFKLGVHFDWTYGMPVVYGSSVKGVLRNALIAKIVNGKIIEYEDYFLKKVTKREWSQQEIATFFNEVFEGKAADGHNISIYERDIFYDAVIESPDNKGRILCSDSITPHGENPLKNPVPITFLKIAPGCKLQFRFKLVGTEEEKKLKRDLFKEILTTVGIGAKTNVGYGQLKEAQ